MAAINSKSLEKRVAFGQPGNAEAPMVRVEMLKDYEGVAVGQRCRIGESFAQLLQGKGVLKIIGEPSPMGGSLAVSRDIKSPAASKPATPATSKSSKRKK